MGVFFVGLIGQLVQFKDGVVIVLSYFVQVYNFVLQEYVHLGDTVGNALLKLSVYREPDRLGLFHNAFFVKFVWVEALLVVVQKKEFVFQKARNFLVTLTDHI